MSFRRSLVLAGSVAVVLALPGCGRARDDVRAGPPIDTAALVQASIAGALGADAYRAVARVTTIGGTAAPVTGGAGRCPVGASGDGMVTEMAISPGRGWTALLDPATKAPRVVSDDQGSTFLATAVLPGGAGAPADWARVDVSKAWAVGMVEPVLASQLLSPTSTPQPQELLQLIERSAGAIEAIDRGEIDGVAVSHQRITIDPSRFDAAEREYRRAHPPALPPGVSESSAPVPAPPDVDMWIDDAGVLRRLRGEQTFPVGGVGPGNATGLAFELTFSGFGEPFPTPVPPPGDTVDLGSLPASVLLPLPDCLDAAATAMAPGTTVPPVFREYTRCLTDARERAAAGRTVSEWLADPASFMTAASCSLPDLSALIPRSGDR